MFFVLLLTNSTPLPAQKHQCRDRKNTSAYTQKHQCRNRKNPIACSPVVAAAQCLHT
jgi:hypothetical protein